MRYELYIDRLFLENLILNYLALMLEGRLLRQRKPSARLLAAGAAGSLALCGLIAARLLPGNGCGAALLAVLLGGGMACVSFRPHGVRELAEETAALFAAAFLLAGPAEWLVQTAGLPAVLSGLIAYTVCAGVLGRARRRDMEKAVRTEATVTLGRASVRLKALIDTGNQLKEPLSGRPVSILDAGAAQRLLRGCWPDAAVDALDKGEAALSLMGGHANPDGSALRGLKLIPYHSVGRAAGLLIAFTADRLVLEGGKNNTTAIKPVLAVSPEPVSARGEYQMILHPLHAKEGGK